MAKYADAPGLGEMVGRRAAKESRFSNQFVPLRRLWHHLSSDRLALLQWQLDAESVRAEGERSPQDRHVYDNFRRDKWSSLSLHKATCNGYVFKTAEI